MPKGISISEPIINNSVDQQYNPLPNLDANYGPYRTIKEAIAALPREIRTVGLTVGIRKSNVIKEYWFNGGIENENLVIKQAESGDKPVQTVYIQDTPPANINSLWVDTSGLGTALEKDEKLAPIIQSIQVIQQYLDTIVHQRDLIINPGHVSNTFSKSIAKEYTPIDPNTGQIDIRVAAVGESLEPETDQYEPNTKAVRGHYGTLKEIQDNFKDFVDYELLIATDAKRLYTKIDGEPVNLTGSTFGGGGGGGLDYEALDKLDTIGFVAPNGQVYRVKVNNNGQLVVYKKELDTPQAEPTGGQEEPGTGWVYVTTLYLQKLYINSLYCGGITSDEYSYNPCSHNFVELSNLTGKDVSLNGLSLQYGTEGGNWEVLPLWGNIKAGSTFLIRGAQCSVMNTNTTRIKVETYDMEWYAKDGNLIKFDNKKAKFFLTWGTEPSTVANPYNNASSPIKVSKGYIDLVGLQIRNAGDADKVDAAENTAYGYLTSNYLFTKYYTMDNVKQATKALSARNNANDMYFVNLEADVIPRVDSYTPRASFENKNIFFNKTLLDHTKPNKITMTLGRKACYSINESNEPEDDASRCFNWVSVGYYDEYLWYRAYRSDGSYTNWTKVESFKNETGVRKYYNRIRAITTDGTPFTTHKVILTHLGAQQDTHTGDKNVYYEYYVGRDETYKSDIRRFVVMSETLANDSLNFVQTSDQQGFNWDEYNVWRISAEQIKKDFDRYENSDVSVCYFMINTGDMTQNGNRINEWLDYEAGRKSLYDIAEMVTVGNNDLTPANVYVLGDGGDNSKINATNIRFFYCYEMDEENPPVFNVEGKEIFVESLYSFDVGERHFLCVNSEISSNTERDVYGLTTTGVMYDLIREWCERDDTKATKAKAKIAYCHEMPFTIITQNLINSFYWNGQEDTSVERSGSRLNFNTTKANAYWFSKFLQTHSYRLCIGGHKHTYSCSYPLLENENSSMKPIIQVTADVLQSDFGSTELYTEIAEGALQGQSFPKSWENNTTFDMLKHLCTFQLVEEITAPIYLMCQATGYKHTSNKELPSPNIPWLRYFFPASITINSRDDVTAKVNAGQRYPFYIKYFLNKGKVSDFVYYPQLTATVKKLSNVFNNSGKYNVNIEGLNPNYNVVGGNGETNNGNDIINVKFPKYNI